MKKILVGFLLFSSMVLVAQEKEKGFEFIDRPVDKRVDLFYKDVLITSYRYDDSVRKPFLYPLNTLDGITITRGFPLEPRPGDRTDHPHQVGMWMNYESVNGYDFWNNSTAIEPSKRDKYGTILHENIIDKTGGLTDASLVISAKWMSPDGRQLLDEKTSYQFRIENNDLLIERSTMLTAQKEKVYFRDVKDGFFAIRLARELEMPSTEKSDYIGKDGKISKEPVLPAGGLTGMYTSSEGLQGDSVWGTRARWVMMQGKKDGKDVTVAIFDHPSNIYYPSYWHARGYGLFSVNPLGPEVFSKGAEKLDMKLEPGQSAHFRYRVFIGSGRKHSADEINAYATEFSE